MVTSNAYLTFQFNTSLVNDDVILMIHSEYDSPDADFYNTLLYPKKGNWLDAAITKRMISSEPTRQIPCEDHDFGACRDIRGNAIIAEELGCKVTFLNSGKHLIKHIPGYLALPECSESNLEQAITLFIGKKDECTIAKACKKSIFTAKENYGPNNSTLVFIHFANFMVEHYETYVYYDTQSLIAEIGGLIGMTVGLAFSSVGDFLADFVRRRL